jgi:hypothetical protein
MKPVVGLNLFSQEDARQQRHRISVLQRIFYTLKLFLKSEVPFSYLWLIILKLWPLQTRKHPKNSTLLYEFSSFAFSNLPIIPAYYCNKLAVTDFRYDVLIKFSFVHTHIEI